MLRMLGGGGAAGPGPPDIVSGWRAGYRNYGLTVFTTVHVPFATR
jgi:hypothetical protein